MVDGRACGPMKSAKHAGRQIGFTLDRMPSRLQTQLAPILEVGPGSQNWLALDRIHCGDARRLLPKIRPNSISLSVWSPPYFVGKAYEAHLTFQDWQELIHKVIAEHF